MGGRDHSYECETCGVFRSGLNDLRCDCDPCETCGEHGTSDVPCRCGRLALVSVALGCLAGNLETAGALCEAARRGPFPLTPKAHEPHEFSEAFNDVDCTICGEGFCYYLHTDRPEYEQ